MPKLRPVAELRAGRGVNQRAGRGARKRIGSPSQTKGVLRLGDTCKVIDLEWLTRNVFAAVSASTELFMTTKLAPEIQNNLRGPR